jgi:hypothetical protein
MSRDKRKFSERGWALLEADLIESPAFWALSSANSVRVLVRFWQKRRFAKKRSRGKGKYGPEIVNNGQITFTGSEADELGIKSRSTFLRAVKELIEAGFLDIREGDQEGFRPGYGRRPTRYRISDRWRSYGTSLFQRESKGRVLPKGLGFQRGNTEWEKAAKNKN